MRVVLCPQIYIIDIACEQSMILTIFTTDLTQILATSDNWYELEWAWVGWRRESGANMPDMYEEFAGLLNLAAEMNGGLFVNIITVNSPRK